ncbi:hypothetical protein GOBAR_AA01298 [Gossypium barbadense]|uniref:Uncharacterized protein n=1 Tax=Gossypium barbadense TaxID=3634 RepID=A0A2P5YUJ7_GOSBA|nr:hypothetical protein GOBAR_AA01298 [Gossypium barbadense]
MTTYLILPDEIITSAQRKKVDKMMREVQDYRMKPEEDIVQHVITIEEEEDPEEFPNWIVEDEYEDNQEYLNWIVQYFPEGDTDPIKFTEMELVGDEDVETIIALYCRNESDKNAPIHLFVELAGMEQNEDLTVYGEEYGAQEPCMVAPISFVDSESTIGGIDIDFNVTPNIDVVGDDGYDSNDPCDQEVDSDSDPDVDDVPDDIDDEDVNDNGNINASSVRNQMRRIVIYNNPRPHISLIDPDAAHVAEFLEYPEILPAHRLAVNFDPKELFVGQRFES